MLWKYLPCSENTHVKLYADTQTHKILSFYALTSTITIANA